MSSQTRAVDNTGFGDNAWINPTEAYAQDGTCATGTSGDKQDYNFHNTPFSIPDGATTTGLKVIVYHAEGDSDDITNIKLYDEGDNSHSKDTANNGPSTQCSDCVETSLGGDSDLWGGVATDWPPSHINSDNFYLELLADATGKSGGTWWCDYIEVTVYYTEGAEQNTKEFTADGWLLKRGKKEPVADAYLLKRGTQDISTDAYLTLHGTVEISSDGILLKRGTADFSTDALLLQLNSLGISTDGILLKRGSKDFTSDAWLLKRGSSPFTSDALLLQRNAMDFTADGWLLKRGVQPFTADGLLTKQNSLGFTVDSWLLQRNIADFTVDGWLLQRNVQTWTVDAYLTFLGTKTFSVDAILVVSAVAPEVGDAWLGPPVPRPEISIYLLLLIRDYLENKINMNT